MKNRFTQSTNDRNIIIDTKTKKQYHLSLLDQVADLHKAISPLLNTIAPKECSDMYTTIDKLDPREYQQVSVGTKYYINKSIIPLSELDNAIFHKAIIKCAFYENYIDFKNESSDTCFVHFIYGSDKKTNLEARGLSDIHVDRFDRFKGAREKKSSGPLKGQYVIRHTGTHEGGKKRSTQRCLDNRNENIEFLRILMNGPNFMLRPLHCPKFGLNIEGFGEIFNSLTGDTKDIPFFEIHHAKFVSGESTNKSGVEPSYIISRKNYRNLSSEDVNELLHCIILSNSYHSMIHKSHRHDDIQGWYGRLLRGEVSHIPYHWNSQEKYEKTTSWLVENVDNYTEDDVIPWEEFVQMNTFSRDEKQFIVSELNHNVRPNAVFEHIKDHSDIN